MLNRYTVNFPVYYGHSIKQTHLINGKTTVVVSKLAFNVINVTSVYYS